MTIRRKVIPIDVDFAVGVLAVSKERAAAQELLKFMASAEAAPLIRKSGMEPPPR
jgi:ABC-type molybdate transport system substrate-binding protein